MSQAGEVSRREFLQQAAVLAGTVAAASIATKSLAGGGGGVANDGSGVAIVSDPKDPIAASAPVTWAKTKLKESLQAKKLSVREIASVLDARANELCIVIANGESRVAQVVNAKVADGPEALIIAPGNYEGRRIMLAAANDPRGLVYAITELADRINHSNEPLRAMNALPPVSEKPANTIRSICRLFVSELEDKPWYYDRSFWPRYLDMLALNRFNRFNLSLGLSYDFSTGLRDSYFFFAYPFLLDVPGFKVRPMNPAGVPLPEDERKKNLETLQFISAEAAARGLHFQLGIWTHSYKWANSPNVNYNIDGLNDESQAPYSRDAMRMLLEQCPHINGLTLRTHGESGVPEGRYDIWKVIMSGAMGLKNPDGSARSIELDLHGKSITTQMIETARATGNPVTISPKFNAEHMGLPYMQASIRPQEAPRRDAGGLMSLSSGSRNFIRYSFGDLLTKDRTYKVITRVWPGTQRLLLWGDPLYAAQYGRNWSFCGMDGVEYFDPLSFKGRADSGQPPAVPNAGRSGYAEAPLVPPDGDWTKYLYQYRLWGRLSYNPDSTPDVWQRYLQSEFAATAPHVESALANSSRMLPLISTSFGLAGANFLYWPEMLVNMSLYDERRPGPTGEAPTPKIFANVTAIDPQLFASIAEYADSLLAGKPLPKYTPLETSLQLETWSKTAFTEFDEARKAVHVSYPATLHRALMRVLIDATIVAGIGAYYANKLRAGIFYAVFDRTGHEPARQQALAAYRLAREAWASLSETGGVYANDLSFGPERQLRRNWRDRLADIDVDITGIQTAKPRSPAEHPEATITRAMAAIQTPQPRTEVKVAHEPPKTFARGKPLDLAFSLPANQANVVRLRYRHVHQGEGWQSIETKSTAPGTYAATIPAEYCNTNLPLQYYLEIEPAAEGGAVALYPGFGENFLKQPYLVAQPA